MLLNLPEDQCGESLLEPTDLETDVPCFAFRLRRPRHVRLATAKNLTLADGPEFSLADIYRGPDSADPVSAEPTMGFRR